jgi:hypothetical protein
MRNSEIETVVVESNALQNLDDANYHLQSVQNILDELLLDCNRNRRQYLLCNKALQDLQIIYKICNRTDLTLPLKIALEINRLFSVDKNLYSVFITIENSKRIINPSAIAHLRLTL